jgi:phosphoglycolate phosphatase-like HAD superfamily hydrolase
MKRYFLALLIVSSFWACTQSPQTSEKVESDPLALWNEGENKTAILDFVNKVTDGNSKSFVPIEDRIAVFDNDGTLWIEKPLYVPVEFEMAWLKEESKSNPDLLNNELYKGLIEGDMSVMKKYSTFQLIEQLFGAHAGQDVNDYLNDSWTFLDTANHQRYNKPFKYLTYNPMVELVAYLQENDFDVFIVTGGEIDFVRSVSEEIYNIPPEMVVGSNVKYEYVSDAKDSKVIRTKELNSANDKFVKPANIQLHIGKKPIFAAGNSDGDYEMMEYTLSGDGPSMAVLVHHDDEDREYVYMHGTEKAIEDAKAQGWYVVSIKEDFKEVFNLN